MSDLIVNLTDHTLDEMLNHSPLPVLLDLWAPWCAPCLAVAPLLEKVAVIAAGQLTVAKLNVQEYESLMPRFHIRGIPTLLLFHNGAELARKTGVDSLSDLNGWLRSQGIAIEAEGEVVLPAASPWPSFYQDASLLRFLSERLKARALAGEISHYHFPRPEGLLTAPYVLAGQESLDVFERVTGLPPALALWLEYLDFLTPQQIDELIAVLAPGKDYSRVPLRLLTSWLSDDNIAWETLLAAPLDAMRQQWLRLAADYLAGMSTLRQSWLTLQQQLLAYAEQCQSGRYFECNLCKQLSILSPPTALENVQANASALHCWFECQHYLERLNAGWNADDFLMAERRYEWIEPQLPQEESQEGEYAARMQDLRQEWAQQSPEFARYAEKECAFYAEFPASLPQRKKPLRIQFLALLKEAPDTF